MDGNLVQQALNELLPYLEALDTRSTAILQFLKDKKLITEEEFAPYLEQAGNMTNIKWLAARVRIERLLSSPSTEEEKTAAVGPEKPGAEKTGAEKPDAEKPGAKKAGTENTTVKSAKSNPEPGTEETAGSAAKTDAEKNTTGSDDKQHDEANKKTDGIRKPANPGADDKGSEQDSARQAENVGTKAADNDADNRDKK